MRLMGYYLWLLTILAVWRTLLGDGRTTILSLGFVEALHFGRVFATDVLIFLFGVAGVEGLFTIHDFFMNWLDQFSFDQRDFEGFSH